jgi:transposase
VPLLSRLIARGITPAEVWADRGYAGRKAEASVRELGITPRFSQPRRGGDPIPSGVKVWVVTRGKKKVIKTSDPEGRHRWPVERTNAWLKGKRRIATRYDVKPENYLAFLRVGMIYILLTSF